MKAHHHKPSSAMPSPQILAALAGIFISAMMAGLNSRVGALELGDVRGTLGVSQDESTWITTFYSVGELIATPFATWFAITLSLRRFHFIMISTCTLIAAVLPFIHNVNLLIILRFFQGISCGALIPILMMSALKFLPAPIRLHGLALYAMTATFAPNLAIWLSGQWADSLNDLRWIYWEIIPLCVISGLLVAWGLPLEKIQTARFHEANWFGMFFCVMALALITIALDEGIRLDWFNSSLIPALLVTGLIFLAIYLFTEWFHHAPFIKLQLLSRRNLWLGSAVFVALLVVMLSGAQIPSTFLGAIQDYRALQTAPIGLLIALPQLILGSIVALFLYQKWIDARVVFAAGLALIALACFSGSQLTSDWNREQFIMTQIIQAVGQPMSVVSLLFLMTSMVQPSEGPYFSGTINTLRQFGSLIGGACIGQFLVNRERFHTDMLLDHAGSFNNAVPNSLPAQQLAAIVNQQSLVLSVADAYRVLGILAIILIPLVLRLTYIPAPETNADGHTVPAHPVSSPSTHG